MSLRKKYTEIKRLIEAFEIEAQKFHDLRFSIYYLTQNQQHEDVKFDKNNHCIMLWQYYGVSNKENNSDDFIRNLENSNIQFGVRGAKITALGVLEGSTANLFVRMAKRAGNLFNKKEKDLIKGRTIDEITSKIEKSENEKTISIVNNDLLSIWLNYILYHMSLINPGETQNSLLGVDPYSLSLLALEHLLLEQKIGKIDKSITAIEKIKFKVSLSFPGEKRPYVSQVAEKLRTKRACK